MIMVGLHLPFGWLVDASGTAYHVRGLQNYNLYNDDVLNKMTRADGGEESHLLARRAPSPSGRVNSLSGSSLAKLSFMEIQER
jgi:hypothetical protein